VLAGNATALGDEPPHGENIGAANEKRVESDENDALFPVIEDCDARLARIMDAFREDLSVTARHFHADLRSDVAFGKTSAKFRESGEWKKDGESEMNREAHAMQTTAAATSGEVACQSGLNHGPRVNHGRAYGLLVKKSSNWRATLSRPVGLGCVPSGPRSSGA
jgi:hypothetical protein